MNSNAPDDAADQAATLAKQGRTDEAVRLLREVLAKGEPRADLLCGLANLLRSQGQTAEALFLLRKAARLSPEDPQPQIGLGLCLLSQGQGEEALAAFDGAIRLAPDRAEGHKNRALALQAMNRLDEAKVGYLKAIQLDPKDADCHLGLGFISNSEGNAEEAFGHFQAAVRADPDSVRALVQLGQALLEREKAAEAAGHLRRAVELAPGASVPHQLLGEALVQSGDIAEARAMFARAIAIQPRNVDAYYGLFKSKKVREEDREAVGRAEALAAEVRDQPKQARNIQFALGKAFNDLGEPERAMRHFDEAHRLTLAHPLPDEKRFVAAEYEAFVKRVMATFTADAVAHREGIALTTEAPTFIVGMPRSGTTLVEQIVSNHPSVAAGGEIRFWVDNGPDVLVGQAGIDRARSRELGIQYEALLKGISPTAKRVTDKMPTNYVFIGLLHMLFPRARFVHCRRNPLDNGLSLYTTLFGDPPEFVHRREDIVTVYRLYLRLMEHWRRVIPPDRILDLPYEDLVAAPEENTRRLIGFLGLEWNDACLHPEANTRSLATPSVWQVRQPVYSTSVDRWRAYEPWLGELKELADL